MKKTFTMHIFRDMSAFSGEEPFTLLPFDTWHDDTRINLGAVEVTVDIPEHDPRQLGIEAIEQQIAKVRAVAQNSVEYLEQRKQQLMALEAPHASAE